MLLTKRPELAKPMIWDALDGDPEIPEPHVLEAVRLAESFPNLWIGASVENQAAADRRIPALAAIPAAVRFLSCEPLLGPLDLSPWIFDRGAVIRDLMKEPMACNRDQADSLVRSVDLSWIIVGGESGPGARPMRREWALSLRDQCQAASVPFFFKQWGDVVSCWNQDLPDDVIGDIDADVNLAGYGGPEWFRVGKKAAGRTLDGREWSEFPVVA